MRLCDIIPVPLAPHSGRNIRETFGRQALGMVWDFCEVYPLSDSTGDFLARGMGRQSL